MQIWYTQTEADDGALTNQGLHRSEKEAREKVGETNGMARLVEVDTDKDGIIKLFNRDDFVKSTIKSFTIKAGRWKASD
ncbi:MAG: hypothetical protein H0U59_12910 [Gemmatimonadaceae bacterium]|nr:hypothetical protein [Gemmatimonadaceae bacterium]